MPEKTGNLVFLCEDLNPRAAGNAAGARLGRRCRLSSMTTAPETDIHVGFPARALCPATLPLPEKMWI
jgi:hypothetical protein